MSMLPDSTRRRFLHTAAGLAAGAVNLPIRHTHSQAKRRNVIFILIDDQRYDFLSCLGHPWIETPHIDRLAAGGAIFDNAFVTTSLCSPSRATIMTGLYAHSHQVMNNSTPLNQNITTFPSVLQQQGYHTGFIGKWHMGGDNDDPRPGFDYWLSFRGQGVYVNPTLNINGERVTRQGYTTDILTDYACEFLEARTRGQQPFFLYLSHKAIHGPFTPAERHRGHYANLHIPKPLSYPDTDKNYWGKPDWVRRQRYGWHGVEGPCSMLGDFDTMVRQYGETMLSVDDSIGQLTETLERLGLLEDTLILYMGDNGYALGEHGHHDKRTMYEPSIRVPCFAHCPALIGGDQRRQELVLNLDIGETILDAAGVPIPASMQGTSFLPLARGEQVPWRNEFLYEYFWEAEAPHTPTILGLRTDQYSYMTYHGMWAEYELYDMQRDPDQMHNLLGHIEYGQYYGNFPQRVRQQDPQRYELVADLERRLDGLLDQTGGRRLPYWGR